MRKTKFNFIISRIVLDVLKNEGLIQDASLQSKPFMMKYDNISHITSTYHIDLNSCKC